MLTNTFSHARLIAGTEHDGTRALAEEHTGRAVLVVHHARQHLHADHERMLDTAVGDELVRRRKRIQEAAARRLHVEGAALSAQRELHEVCGGGEGIVGADRGDDDEAKIFALETSAFERLSGRGDGEGGSGFTRCCDVPLLDAGAAGDPLVRRIHDPLEIGIGENFLWDAHPPARDRTVLAHGAPQVVPRTAAWPTKAGRPQTAQEALAIAAGGFGGIVTYLYSPAARASRRRESGPYPMRSRARRLTLHIAAHYGRTIGSAANAASQAASRPGPVRGVACVPLWVS